MEAQAEKPAGEHESSLNERGKADLSEYLTFIMGSEEFGVDILAVQEIRGWEPVTAVPNAPRQVCGVMNLRGTVAPVVDLRVCFGVDERVYTDKTVVIVLKIATQDKSREKVVGVVADAVADVESFSAEDVQASPELGTYSHMRYVKGLGRTDQKMVILLELSEHLLREQDELVTSDLRDRDGATMDDSDLA